ncbi:DUF4167 domain-containing protein [Novosphingobium sp.]|uniref:DUF4167 domain-containing protein n=1 Tax=Novosphingobium sp. TaxID=1874826 RepID=UPI0025F08014|nr:DUF4167 domain-containing protein [Novosphingobium sp.]MCC6927304.1 DUF4167 domain-containing protein [Novosphingobium sp.]
MNNNRGNNNNRRRGRGNRQNNGGGGGQQLNRIDSRARGNAPQLLEKYRKLAHDAHLNGDRVQAEYYLQFADHYFRVLADARLRQEEQRQRRDERWEGGNEDADEGEEFSSASDFPSFDQPTFTRPQRDNRPQREERESEAPRAEADAEAEAEQAEDAGGDNPYEPAENPFLRENRNRGGLRPRRERGPRRDEQGDAEPAGLDPASLPPAISAGRDEPEAGEDAPKPRRGRPRKKPAGDDTGGEALESVG